MKAFVLSDNADTLTGMRLAGIDGKVLHEREEVLRELTEIYSKKDIGLVIITEGLAEKVKDQLNRLKLRKGLPIIIEVPDRHGSRRPPDFLTRYIKESVGIKI
ncbi:V-type ATP synthase subunit F [Thermosediminibacter oceani]|uniref:Vacuolar H+transporting two-sector ATPase F subunit n=1 Tax=Thermosediminibacter oceani (strain ATCC BAA-1034 / DSM 16646 / JW/IW-1228P) TaxID=555079 RepID=D9RYN3_THEOJ|nr:V-type ATP synthase subunit F [Thermosediminibacter oceani]ADL08457.1 Vacuolar H+transporting two-sector ATPase F subunit [Thermosediminibacter oceani DSM 16646]